jgi:hypothetical protein
MMCSRRFGWSGNIGKERGYDQWDHSLDVLAVWDYERLLPMTSASALTRGLV